MAYRALAALVGLAVVITGCSSGEPPQAKRGAAPVLGYDDVIPLPAEVEQSTGGFALDEHTAVAAPADAAARAVADDLAAGLRSATGLPIPVTTSGAITLRLDAPAAAVGAEGYELTVTGSGVRLQAHSPAGLFHGVQTILQLLPAKPGSTPPAIAAGRVVDRPRYAWRGAMLDVARHFFSVADVERYIDDIARYKLDVLHLHLSDDQGWRIAIDGWPRLTSYGATTSVGGDHGGFYTQSDYRVIVAYAAARFVTVVPEIDLPGHTEAALASYPELACDGKKHALYTGTEVGFSSLCGSRAVTWRFVDDVLGQLARLTPGGYLHVGGDEAQATSPGDYVAFVDRVQQTVAKHGKKAIAWAEAAQGTLRPGTVLQFWDTRSPTDDLARAAQRGAHVVMSPASRTYLDQKYDANTPLGLSWAGYVSVKDAYDWDPATIVPGVPAADVIGVEAPLWSETLRTMADVETMAFPRLPALAEVAWSPQSRRHWASFAPRLAKQAARWQALGIAFTKADGVPWP